MKLKFVRTTFLKLFRRPLLAAFLGRFTNELTAKELTLPAAELNDDAFYSSVSTLARAPEGLPHALFEALHGIQAMATMDGHARLEREIEQSPLAGTFLPDSTEPEYALQAFVAAPVLFARKLNEMKLTRIGRFEGFRSRVPVDRRQTFTAPDAVTIARMVGDMDQWFPQHSRGVQLTVIEVIEINGEFWFVIRHGNTFTRVPTAGANREVEVLHFRPTTDDVVVYSPQFDEISVHTATKGEVMLYREVFGVRLFGDPRYFSERLAYRLDPLRDDGPDALDPIPGIDRVVLRGVQWAWDNALHDVETHESDDVFAAAADLDPERLVIPSTARAVEAAFDFHFTGASKPRRVVLRPPNNIKFARYSDAGLVHTFFRERQFKTAANGARDAAA